MPLADCANALSSLPPSLCTPARPPARQVDFVRSLLAPLSDIPYNQVERVMVDGVSRKQLHLRIDHSEGCLRFGSALTQGNVVDTHVAQFGSTLSKLAGQASEVLLQATGPNALAQAEAAKSAARSAYLQIVASRMDDEMEMLVRRKGAIEMRKEGLERQLAITVERTRISIEEQEARRKKLEDARLEEEAKQRAEADRRRNEEKLAVMKLQKELARYSITLNEEEIVAMSALDRATMIKEAKATEQKAKDDAARRVYEQARRLDHITRAVRIEGSGIIGQKYAEQCEQDRLAHEAMRLLEETKGREAHALDLLEKARMARMQAHRMPFEGPLVAAQEEAFKRREEKRLEKAVVDMRQKRVSRARQRYSDDLEAREAEEEERVERERLEKETEERLVRENQERIRQQREADELEERRIFEVRPRILFTSSSLLPSLASSPPLPSPPLPSPLLYFPTHSRTRTHTRTPHPVHIHRRSRRPRETRSVLCAWRRPPKPRARLTHSGWRFDRPVCTRP